MLFRILLIFLLLFAGSANADMILLLSDDRPSVAGVEQAIRAAYSQRIETHNLGGSRNREAQTARAILDSDIQQVVAVGLQAAQLAREKFSAKQVVFCQVLNFEEFDLITPWMKGVSAIPSLSRQFSIWKLLDPNLRRIGIITGRNSKYFIQEAETAAKRQGLELVHMEVSSERAVLFAAQELYEKKVQGIWLAPDSSILSQRAVLDLMSFSVKHHLQVLSFSPALLKEGALISTNPDFQEIARVVLERLKKAGDILAHPSDGVMPLQNVRMVVNGNAASRFGLGISVKVRELVDVQ